MRAAVARVGLRVATALTVAFLYLPIAVIALYAFNGDRGQTWPITNFSLQWFGDAFTNESVRDAMVLSVSIATLAMLAAVVLGTAASLAVHRYRFFGRDVISFALVLPIALPGIITGIALNAAFRGIGLGLGTLTIVIGHATFCVVVVYNNVIARLRRSSSSLEEASADLGADQLQTFRHVTLPVIRTALLAGALLAFALSFDEIIVTYFVAGTQETIPIWIYDHLHQPNQRPIVNVVALFVILLSTIPVYISQRLVGAEATAGAATGASARR
ncbi:MAG TPA: ABC transporter permease [Candidatus Sulfotelmatobacter sp.]|nr:ABC transporter permease [Candidatus Sulfotelmatobacter sp.]